jgi:deazaflavin-dependent oxidoreductase (nitroreductase family)
MNVQQQLHRGWLIVLKHTLNPLTRRIARSSVGPFAIVRHIGRHSGKVYETPIIVAPVKDGFVIELSYGHDVDWHKNVLAAGGCTILRHGKEFVINKIEPIDAETGRAAFSSPQRFILRLLRRKDFEKLRFQP